MLKDTKFIPARESAELWSGRHLLAWAKHGIEVSRGRPREHRRLRAFVLVVPCLAAGAIGGSIAGWSLAMRSAHHKGACAAIQMAAAHGYLDERQQRIVMRTLVTAINPDVESFSGGHRAMRDVCTAAGGRS